MSDRASSCFPSRSIETRETMIDRGESFQTADVERISFRKLDFLRASEFKSFLWLLYLINIAGYINILSVG